MFVYDLFGLACAVNNMKMGLSRCLFGVVNVPSFVQLSEGDAMDIIVKSNFCLNFFGYDFDKNAQNISCHSDRVTIDLRLHIRYTLYMIHSLSDILLFKG